MQLTQAQLNRLRRVLTRAKIDAVLKTEDAIESGYAVFAGDYARYTVQLHHAWEDIYNLELEQASKG